MTGKTASTKNTNGMPSRTNRSLRYILAPLGAQDPGVKYAEMRKKRPVVNDEWTERELIEQVMDEGAQVIRND